MTVLRSWRLKHFHLCFRWILEIGGLLVRVYVCSLAADCAVQLDDNFSLDAQATLDRLTSIL